MCDLLVPLVTWLDAYRIGLTHDAFSDHPFDGLSRDGKDVEEPVKDVREGKSYHSLIMLNPALQILKLTNQEPVIACFFEK